MGRSRNKRSADKRSADGQDIARDAVRGGRRGQGATEAVVETVDGGLAELIPDRDRPRAWTLLIDGAPSRTSTSTTPPT